MNRSKNNKLINNKQTNRPNIVTPDWKFLIQGCRCGQGASVVLTWISPAPSIGPTNRRSWRGPLMN